MSRTGALTSVLVAAVVIFVVSLSVALGLRLTPGPDPTPEQQPQVANADAPAPAAPATVGPEGRAPIATPRRAASTCGTGTGSRATGREDGRRGGAPCPRSRPDQRTARLHTARAASTRHRRRRTSRPRRHRAYVPPARTTELRSACAAAAATA